jgi:hypothetical protein
MTTLQTCVDRTTPPFGRLIGSGSTAGRMLFIGVPAITKWEVAPVSAMACDGGTVNVASRGRAEAATSVRFDELDATTVSSSISLNLLGSEAYVEISFLIL